jgi:muramoyltetrapeptide carboxypeptidase
VLAGNLATLCHLVGTAFQPQLENHILLLEDCNEAPYRIDRMLSQMKQAGCLEGLAGLGLGLFQNCGDEEEIIEIVQEVIDAPQLPMLAGLPLGHGPANMTVPVGLEAVLDTESGEVRFSEPATL